MLDFCSSGQNDIVTTNLVIEFKIPGIILVVGQLVRIHTGQAGKLVALVTQGQNG